MLYTITIGTNRKYDIELISYKRSAYLLKELNGSRYLNYRTDEGFFWITTKDHPGNLYVNTLNPDNLLYPVAVSTTVTNIRIDVIFQNVTFTKLSNTASIFTSEEDIQCPVNTYPYNYKDGTVCLHYNNFDTWKYVTTLIFSIIFLLITIYLFGTKNVRTN